MNSYFISTPCFKKFNIREQLEKTHDIDIWYVYMYTHTTKVNFKNGKGINMRL